MINVLQLELSSLLLVYLVHCGIKIKGTVDCDPIFNNLDSQRVSDGAAEVSWL